MELHPDLPPNAVESRMVVVRLDGQPKVVRTTKCLELIEVVEGGPTNHYSTRTEYYYLSRYRNWSMVMLLTGIAAGSILTLLIQYLLRD